MYVCVIFHPFRIDRETFGLFEWQLFPFSDADLERLLEQWDEDDEPIPADELPDGHPKKPSPSLDLTKIDLSRYVNFL